MIFFKGKVIKYAVITGLERHRIEYTPGMEIAVCDGPINEDCRHIYQAVVRAGDLTGLGSGGPYIAKADFEKVLDQIKAICIFETPPPPPPRLRLTRFEALAGELE